MFIASAPVVNNISMLFLFNENILCIGKQIQNAERSEVSLVTARWRKKTQTLFDDLESWSNEIEFRLFEPVWSKREREIVLREREK